MGHENEFLKSMPKKLQFLWWLGEKKTKGKALEIWVQITIYESGSLTNTGWVMTLFYFLPLALALALALVLVLVSLTVELEDLDLGSFGLGTLGCIYN